MPPNQRHNGHELIYQMHLVLSIIFMKKNEKFLKNFLRPYCRRKRRLKRSEESIKAWDTQAGIPRRCSYVTFPVALDHPVAHSDVGLDILGAALVHLQLFAQRGHKDPQGGQFR